MYLKFRFQIGFYHQHVHTWANERTHSTTIETLSLRGRGVCKAFVIVIGFCFYKFGVLKVLQNFPKFKQFFSIYTKQF